jgi:hypothetical protein
MPTPGEGEILVAIDKFAMTANNVTYAASGDLFGYWQFYPTGEDPWGKVTVWGIGEVVASHVEGIAGRRTALRLLPNGEPCGDEAR